METTSFASALSCAIATLALSSGPAIADETHTLAEFQSRRREIEERYRAAAEAGDVSGKRAAIEELEALRLRMAPIAGPDDGLAIHGSHSGPASNPGAADAGLGAGADEIPRGKLFLVPDSASGGAFPVPIPIFDANLAPTPEFLEYAKTDPAAARLEEGILLVRQLLQTWRPTTTGLKHLPFWLASGTATPTYVRIVSSLEPTAPRDPARPGNVAAAPRYPAGGNRTMIQFNWGPRGMSPTETTTQDVFTTEFGGFRPSGAANLMVYDREEILAGDDLRELARVVFHEFYYHLSIPEMSIRDGVPGATALNSDYQHGFGDDLYWDADFGEVLRRHFGD